MCYRGRKLDKKLEIQISPWFFLFLAMMLMFLPLNWVIAALLAALIHETFHIFAVLFLGGIITGVHVGVGGAVLMTEPLSGIRESICAFAGPFGSFLLVLLSRYFPRLAICGLIHGLYNLLPIFPLDGGRIFRGVVFSSFSPPVASKIYHLSQCVFRCLLCIIAVAGALKTGALSLLFLVVLLLKTRNENPLAKKQEWRYNSSTILKGVCYDRITATDSPDGSKTGSLHRRRIQ